VLTVQVGGSVSTMFERVFELHPPYARGPTTSTPCATPYVGQDPNPLSLTGTGSRIPDVDTGRARTPHARRAGAMAHDG
jgi:hypothetical protein